MPSLRTTTAVLAVLTCIDLTVSTGSGSNVLCPIVGPAPPAQCDGRDRTWFPVSVVGSGTFCTRGPEICVADQLAACPGPSDQLPYGAKCVQFASKVYSCVPKTSCDDGVLSPGNTSSKMTSACETGCAIDPFIPRQCNNSNGWTPISVVGSATYCVRGPVCSGDAQASCPQPQHGLPFGSTCVRIPSGVFGCVKNTRCQEECSTALPSLGQTTGDHGQTASDSHETPTSTLISIETTAPLSATTTPAPTNGPAVLMPALASTDFQDDNNAGVAGFDEGDDDVALLPVPPIEDSVPVEDAETV